MGDTTSTTTMNDEIDKRFSEPEKFIKNNDGKSSPCGFGKDERDYEFDGSWCAERFYLEIKKYPQFDVSEPRQLACKVDNGIDSGDEEPYVYSGVYAVKVKYNK